MGRVEELGDRQAPGLRYRRERILVTRNRDGELSGYYNLCRHRGSVLDPSEGKPGQKEGGPTGTFKGSIQCPYHAWTYSFDGRLRAAPYLDESDGFRKEDLPLHAIAFATWGGFIWVHLEPSEAAPLIAQLAGADTFRPTIR